MGTNCKTISNQTEGYLVDLNIEIDEFIYGKEPNMDNHLKLADFLINMGKMLYSDAELYGDVNLNTKYVIVENANVAKTEYNIKNK